MFPVVGKVLNKKWKGQHLVNKLNDQAVKESNHPFAKLKPIKTAQDAFEECAKQNLNLTQDFEHLVSNCIAEAYTKETLDELAKYDAVISDSCTCATDPDPNRAWEKGKGTGIEGKDGEVFKSELNTSS